MKPFNVTLIRPDGYPHAHALDDAAEYLTASLIACGYHAVATVNHIDRDSYNVIACAHLLGVEHLAQLPADTIVFNSERLAAPSDWPFASGVYRRFLDAFYVWDYSPANVAALGHTRASVIPFAYCGELRRPIVRTRGRSLLFYGSLTAHRIEILDAIRALGIAIDVVFGEYGAQRDARLRDALAVINLHKLADSHVFEPIRCFYPLIQDCPVISEATDDPGAAPFRDAVSWLAPGTFAAELARIVGDPAAFERRAAGQLAAFRTTSARAAIIAAVGAAVDAFTAACRDRTPA